MIPPSSHPSVSVIIPSYNHARYVRQAVESALRQTRPADEVIVVDDGSTDGTVEVLEPLRRDIRLVIRPNQGVGATYNLGVKESRGEMIAFVESDDLIEPDYLEKTLAFLGERPEVAWVSTARRIIDEDGAPTGDVDGKRSPGALFTTESLLQADLGFCSTPVVRRAALEVAGPFDTSSYACDVDMNLRFSLHFVMGFLDEPLYLYRRYPGNTSSRLRNAELALATIDRFAREHPEYATRHRRVIRIAKARFQGVLAALIFEEDHAPDFDRGLSLLRSAFRNHPRGHLRRWLTVKLGGPSRYGAYRRWRVRRRAERQRR